MSEAETVQGQLTVEDETMSAPEEIPAFADAVTMHQSLVFSIAYHLLHNSSLAEEVAQDVFFRLYRDYHRIQSASHLIHWLRRTTTHRCLDALRRFENRRRVPLDEIENVLPSAATEPDPILARTLRRLVAGLPPKSRAIVVLRYQEDLEPREIARILDLPVNTVKSRLQRALAALRAALRRKLSALEEIDHASDRR
jgi:RNA polymerase sigma-70 factor (ECF subfamily)